MSARPKTSRIVTAVAVLSLIALAPGLGANTWSAAAAPPTDDPILAAEYGVGWLATQIAADGSIEGGFDPLGDAGNAALAIGASGVGGDAFDRSAGHVEANIEAFVAYPFDPTLDDPARLGKAIMIAELAGADPSSFGGTDLVARLEATFGLLEPGLYGGNDPSFDGVFRQGLAITGLLTAGETPPPAAVTWLVDQQCDDATPAAEGAWEDYRADTAVPCVAPDPVTFSGPDTNSTAMAVMALEAVDASYPSATPFLAATQETDGGWSFIPGSGTDPSSTSLVIRALIAAGEDPAGFAPSGVDAWESLLSWQQGCDAPVEDRGSFTFAFADPPGSPDVFSTIDGIAGATGQPYPLNAPVTLAPDAPEVDCTPGGPTTTTTNGPNTGPGPSSNPRATPADALTATPAFTG